MLALKLLVTATLTAWAVTTYTPEIIHSNKDVNKAQQADDPTVGTMYHVGKLGQRISTCSVNISCVKIVFILLRELGLMAICGKLSMDKKKDEAHQQWWVYSE